MIKRYVESYKFEKLEFCGIKAFEYQKDGFVLKIGLKDVPKSDNELLNIEGCIRLTQRVLTPEDEAKFKTGVERGECYFQKTDRNGNAPVVEVEICFDNPEHPEWDKMKLGVNVLQYDITKADLYIVYDGVNFRLVYEGRVVNNNLPFGELSEPKKGEVYVNDEILKGLEFAKNPQDAEFFRDTEILDKKLNYYTPYGHNTFIGDVVNFYHDGTYHMLYMPDRHHHGNRWGGGGHRFEHMITKDFVNWEDVGPIWDVTEQWQSTGTGTMFFHKGKYYVAYGMHSSRTLPEDKLCEKEMKEYYQKHGESMIVSYDELKKESKYPCGANYSVSDDGINFKMGEKIFCICENPSVYSDRDELIMYAGYGSDGAVWRSTDIDKPWKEQSGIGFDCFEKAYMRNSSECPSQFEWNGYKYMIMGVTGFWHTEKDSDEYIDFGAKGYDVYEGLSVPMAAKTDDNRVILAGWLGGIGWGSMVVHRELIQYEDGNLGMKWLSELFPETVNYKSDIRGGEKTELRECVSYYFEAEVDPKGGDIFTVAVGDTKGSVCELKLDLKNNTAQYGSCSEGESTNEILPMYKAIKTVSQKNENGGELCGFNINPDTLPHKAGNFAIANVRYPKDKFKIKMMIYYYDKNCGTVIDTEIAETRTMITNRNKFLANSVKADEKMTNVKVYKAVL